MIDYYYQIKGRNVTHDDYGMGNWSWPPIHSGIVSADSKEGARQEIEDIFKIKFPLRVTKKDLGNRDYLLAIRAITDDRTRKLFDKVECEECGDTFRIIDRYNDPNERGGSDRCCSGTCESKLKEREYIQGREDTATTAVIYKITNKETGLCYIGQTTQAFTLRWWQHFAHGTDTKFHRAIHESKLTDWMFEVIEDVTSRWNNPVEHHNEVRNGETVPIFDGEQGFVRDFSGYLSGRERHWIEHYNSVNNGYNSL